MSSRLCGSWQVAGVVLLLAGCGPLGAPAEPGGTGRTPGTGRTSATVRDAADPAPFNGTPYRELVLSGEGGVGVPSSMRITFTADGRRIVAGVDSLWGVWEVATGRLVGRTGLYGGGRGWPWCLGVTPDGNTLVALNPGSPIVQFWDVRAFKAKPDGNPDRPTREWTVPDPKLRAYGLSPDGGRAYVTGDPALGQHVHDLATGKVVTLNPRDGTASVAFSPDKAKVAGWLGRGSLRLWDAATGQTVWTTELDPAPGIGGFYVRDIVFSPDSRYVGVPTGGGPDRRPHTSVIVVGVADGVERHRIPVATEGFALGGRGPTLAVQTPGHGLRVFDLAVGREVVGFTPPGGKCLGLAVSPDGKTLAVGGLAPDRRGYTVYLTQLPDLTNEVAAR